jgi:hypothetical protein
MFNRFSTPDKIITRATLAKCTRTPATCHSHFSLLFSDHPSAIMTDVRTGARFEASDSLQLDCSSPTSSQVLEGAPTVEVLAQILEPLEAILSLPWLCWADT